MFEWKLYSVEFELIILVSPDFFLCVFFSLQILKIFPLKIKVMFYIYIIETWSQHNLAFTLSEEQTVLEYFGK